MDQASLTAIANIIGQLGIAGIFLWLFAKKDKDKDALVDRLIDSYNQNTKIQEGVKSSLENNTKAIENQSSMTQKIYEQLISRK